MRLSSLRTWLLVGLHRLRRRHGRRASRSSRTSSSRTACPRWPATPRRTWARSPRQDRRREGRRGGRTARRATGLDRQLRRRPLPTRASRTCSRERFKPRAAATQAEYAFYDANLEWSGQTSERALHPVDGPTRGRSRCAKVSTTYSTLAGPVILRGLFAPAALDVAGGPRPDHHTQRAAGGARRHRTTPIARGARHRLDPRAHGDARGSGHHHHDRDDADLDDVGASARRRACARLPTPSTLADSTYACPNRATNEIGDLARSINRLIERLRRRADAQTRFVADASHELATPVAGIRGYTNILRAWGADDPEVRDEAINAIDRESRRMARLTGNLLDTRTLASRRSSCGRCAST